MCPLLSTILRYIKLIPLSVIRERTRRSLRSICAGTHKSGLLPLMKEARIQVYTPVDADVGPRIISAMLRGALCRIDWARVVCANSFSQFHAAWFEHGPHKRGQIIVVAAIIEHSHLINRVRIADSSRPASGRDNYIADYTAGQRCSVTMHQTVYSCNFYARN